MNWNSHLRQLSLVSTLCLSSIGAALAADPAPAPQLKSGARIVVAGDLATSGSPGGYPRVIELYLTACRPDLNAQVLNMGMRTPIVGLRNQIPLMILPYKPNLVTLCYGQDDSSYSAFSPTQEQTFTDILGSSIDQLKAAGIQVVVGSPVAVDTYFYKFVSTGPDGKPHKAIVVSPAADFNATLAQFGERARGEAASHQVPFADVHGDLCEAMKKSKEALGEDYVVCGLDKFYPTITPNGHLAIAGSLLKAMGMKGDIGTITVDLKGKATATEGHKILSSANGKTEIQSSRYPFCFSGGDKASSGTLSIMPFVPFNQDLNRFMLVVKNLDSEKANVTWGTASKVFTKKELTEGINLAAAFAEQNPFSETFEKISKAVADRQASADRMFVSTSNIDRLFGKDPDGAALCDSVRQKFFDKLAKSHDAIQAMVVPLTHTLTVTPE
ncbi:SGNH/GDSL hydrolase family protein [soil metagenome]